MNEVLYRTKEETEKVLGEIVNKGLNNPADLCCVKEAVEILSDISEIETVERSQWSEEESRRSMRGRSGGNSYGQSYGDPYWMEESMRRGRNSRGQFTSGAQGQSQGQGQGSSYEYGYSGHSVNDMMVQALERTITPEMSEVEKQRIYEQIRMIRERKD